MQYVHPLQELVTALEQNLWLLDAYRFHTDAGDDTCGVRATTLRRRRACATLRAALRRRGVTLPYLLPRGRFSAVGPAVNDLRLAEARLLGLYDAALGQAGGTVAEMGLLHDQRAESEQAYLSFAFGLRKDDLALRRRGKAAPVGPVASPPARH